MKRRILSLMLTMVMFTAFTLNIQVCADDLSADIDLNYLIKYYWYYDCGDYTKYQFNNDGTYIMWNYAGREISDGMNRYSLDNNVLTFYSPWGETEWIYADKSVRPVLTFLEAGEKIFYAPDSEYEFIGNTHVEVKRDSEINVILNGAELTFAQSPVIKDDRTLVPLRAIFEAMGATVDWDGTTRTVTSTKGSTTVTMTINSNMMLKNGVEVHLDVPAQLVGDYTMIPVRAVAEAFGADVSWDNDTRTVYIKN